MATIAGKLVSPGAQGTVWSRVEAAEPVRLDPVMVTGTQVALPVSELLSAITVSVPFGMTAMSSGCFSIIIGTCHCRNGLR
jgi:hypothetical protein